MSPPGWQHLRRYQPEANHNRASPRHRSLHSPMWLRVTLRCSLHSPYVAEGDTAPLAPLATLLHGTSATVPHGSAWVILPPSAPKDERSNATVRHHGERSEQRAGGTRLWLAPHRQPRRCRLCGVCDVKEAAACRYSPSVWRAERAACRRYTIVVSPTQTATEVPAVWGM